MNSTSPNIKPFLLYISLILCGCYGDDAIKEVKSIDPISSQELFVSKLKENHLLSYNSLDTLTNIIHSITGKTKFHDRFQINKAYDSTLLNFYIINTERDSTFRNLCAYAGRNIIFLDQYFLTHYLDHNQYLSVTGSYNLAFLYGAFQTWVIGHEVAHADLGHLQGHFIKNSKPVTQHQAWEFHSLELQTDKHSIPYLGDLDRKSLGQMLVAVFNQDFSNTYGMETGRKFNYLKMDNDDYGTYAYKLDGSHSSMAIRAAVFIYLITANKVLKKEASIFLVKSQLHIIKRLIDLPGDSLTIDP